jgi:hypothetical protein
VKGKHNSILVGSNKLKFFLVESILPVRFINFSHLVTMWVDLKKPNPKISSLTWGMDRVLTHNYTIQGWHTTWVDIKPQRNWVDTRPRLNTTETGLTHDQASDPTTNIWLNQTHTNPISSIQLIYRGPQIALDREHDYHDSFILCKGLCPIPTYSDFITFQWLENLHVAMSVKHNHTSFGVRPGDHYLPL